MEQVEQKFSLKVLDKKIAFSTLIQYLGKIVQLVLGILIVKWISIYLTQSGYGVYAAISEYVLFFSVIANLGLFGNIVRKMSDKPHDGKIFVNAFFLRVVSAVVFFVIGFLILIFSNSDRTFLIGSLLFFGALFFDYIVSICDGALQANYLMGRATVALVAGRLVQFILIFIVTNYDTQQGILTAKVLTFQGVENALFQGNEIPVLFLVPLLASFVTAVLSFYFLSKKIKLEWKIDKNFCLDLFKISLPFGIINITNNLYFRFLPDYFANNFLNHAQFGSFNISFRITQVLSLASTFLMYSALPGLKEYIDSGDWGKAKKLYAQIAKILTLAGILLVTIGTVIGPTAIAIVSHKKYVMTEFAFVLPLMLLLAAISYGYDLILITLFALEKDIWLLKREVLSLAISCVFFYLATLFQGGEKLFLIIFAAIVAESLMVILGLRKIRAEFKRH